MTEFAQDRRRLPDVRLMLGLTLPVIAAAAVFGWRVWLVIFGVLLGARVGMMLLRRLFSFPAELRWTPLATGALLIALFMPATLFDADRTLLTAPARWPFPIAMGLLLALTTYAVTRCGTHRVSPIVLTLLAGFTLFPQGYASDRVLQRDHLFRGDLLDARSATRSTSTAIPWVDAEIVRNVAAQQVESPTDRLDAYLRGRISDARPAVTVARLLGDDLPPLEDLVIAGRSGPMWSASTLAVLFGGLFLLHKRMVWFRVPAMMVVIAYVTIILLPVPLIVSPEGIARRWLAPADPRLGWATGITLVNYLILASPTLFTALFIASTPGVRPLGRRAVVAFSLLFGILCGVSIVFVSVAWGPLLAVALAQLLTPTLERALPQSAAV